MLAGWRVLGAWRRVTDHRRMDRKADAASASPASPTRAGREGETGGLRGSPHGGRPDKGKGRSSSSAGDLLIDIRYGLRRLAKNAFSDVLADGGFPGIRGRRIDGGGGEVVVGRGEDIEQAGAWVVSGNYFRVLGVPMGLGAGFSADVQAHAQE